MVVHFGSDYRVLTVHKFTGTHHFTYYCIRMRFFLHTVPHKGELGGMVRLLHVPDRTHVADQIHYQLGHNERPSAPLIICDNCLYVFVLCLRWGARFRDDVSVGMYRSPLATT
jgi:hypothetical protein